MNVTSYYVVYFFGIEIISKDNIQLINVFIVLMTIYMILYFFTSQNGDESASTGSIILEPKKVKKSYEFGGPLGAFLLTIIMPATVFLINYGCTKVN